jgi:hypothetical protein
MTQERTFLRKIDYVAMQAEEDARQLKIQQLQATGQKLFARIRPSSKYYGQGGEVWGDGEDFLFPVVITSSPEYRVSGGPGGQYRLKDVDLFAEFTSGVPPVQITFEN